MDSSGSGGNQWWAAVPTKDAILFLVSTFLDSAPCSERVLPANAYSELCGDKLVVTKMYRVWSVTVLQTAVSEIVTDCLNKHSHVSYDVAGQQHTTA